MRVRCATRQKAHVRAQCVRGKVVRCEVRACEQKNVTPNTLHIFLRKEKSENLPDFTLTYDDYFLQITIHRKEFAAAAGFYVVLM